MWRCLTPNDFTPREHLRNVALFAHVDAGKTSIAEQMLFLSGCTRALGSVDLGTAQTDWLDVERARGISVRLATTVIPWQGATINLIDTPGHIDFVAEVERALQVLEGAVLIISAPEGVQAHTEMIWQALRTRRVPTLLFVNKMDRAGAAAATVAAQIAGLTGRAGSLQQPQGSAETFCAVTPCDPELLVDTVATWES